jgi:quercetin dioxygenase-like cupin family protein
VTDSIQHTATLVDASGVCVAEFAMDPGARGDWHFHSSVKKYLHPPGCRLRMERDGEPAVVLAAGQRTDADPGVVHRIVNAEGTSSRYLVVQGVGRYDFVAVPGAR